MIKFWYAIGEVEQLAFDDYGRMTRPVMVDGIVGAGHIEKDNMLMCRSEKEELKKEYKAHKHKVVINRIDGVPICERCQQLYKGAGDLPWRKWVDNTQKWVSP